VQRQLGFTLCPPPPTQLGLLAAVVALNWYYLDGIALHLRFCCETFGLPFALLAATTTTLVGFTATAEPSFSREAAALRVFFVSP
jgi:hypothetical protein